MLAYHSIITRSCPSPNKAAPCYHIYDNCCIEHGEHSSNPSALELEKWLQLERHYDIKQWLDTEVARVRLSLGVYGRIIEDVVMQTNGKAAELDLFEPSNSLSRSRLERYSSFTIAVSSGPLCQMGLQYARTRPRLHSGGARRTVGFGHAGCRQQRPGEELRHMRHCWGSNVRVPVNGNRDFRDSIFTDNALPALRRVW